MVRSVAVTILFSLISLSKRGITDPLEKITFPYLVIHNVVFFEF